MVIDARLCDAFEIAEIEKKCFSRPWSKAAIENAIVDPLYLVICAFCEDELAAYITAVISPDSVDICNIAVKEKFRRLGFATELLSEIKNRALGKSVFLEVRSKNAAAIALYEKTGFILAGKRKNFYSDPIDDALIMVFG